MKHTAPAQRAAPDAAAGFVAGTLVHTQAGPVPVERIQLGDRVWSCADDGRHGLCLQPVRHTAVHHGQPRACAQPAAALPRRHWATIAALAPENHFLMTSLDLPDRKRPPAAPATPPQLLRGDEFLGAMGRTAGAVVVTFKKRRALDGSARLEAGIAADAAQDQADTNKAPRVYRLHTLLSQVSSADQGVGQGGGQFKDATRQPAGPAPRRRRVIDPARAPGKVTTELFVLPLAEQASRQGSFEPGSFGSADVDSARYSRLMAQLEAVRATLRLAQQARALRIL